MPKITYDKKCLYKDGIPWIPFCGEFHYSRVPEEEWETEIAKMKAGGLDCVSTYIFWNHHEFEKGLFDFTGNRNLSKFLRLCREVGLLIVLRLGPWCHGEARYGGFPDWLVHECRPLRSNDETYLFYVRRFWEQVYANVKQEEDNIFAIQIENEYLFGGDRKGDDHMRTLMALAKDIGFNAPLFTATGWVNSYIGDCLPTFCGYVCAPWARSFSKLPFNDNYMMKFDQNEFHMDNEFNLVHMAKNPHFDRTEFPYLTCELGGGNQVTYHRRPVIGKDDIGAMALVKLATGVNMFGWYMYHGGTNPIICGTYMQESVETGYPNDYPRLSYDFQAPIREYGQLSDAYCELKLFGLFLQDFGASVAPMNTILPAGKMYAPDDTEHLRLALRRKGNSGYLFVNNYVRREKMREHKNVSLKAELDHETIEFPVRDIHDGDYFFYPFNLEIGDALLKYAEASPLCILENPDEKTYVFYAEKRSPAYKIEGDLGKNKLLFISRKDALNAYKVDIDGRQYLIVTQGACHRRANKWFLSGNGDIQISTYPALPSLPIGFATKRKKNGLSVYSAKNDATPCLVGFEKIPYGEGGAYKILLPEINAGTNAFLKLQFAGNYIALYKDGVLIADDYYKDGTWEVSLKRLKYPSELYVKITPLYKDDCIYLEKPPKYVKSMACALYTAEIRMSYEIELVL